MIGSRSGDRGRHRGLGLVVVRGRSMLPTLHDGDVLVVRYGAAGVVGSLAVVRLPGGRPTAVKRLAAAEPAGWWVERDNPAEGVDSWQVGVIPHADLLGLVVARVWPVSGAGRLRPTRPGR